MTFRLDFTKEYVTFVYIGKEGQMIGDPKFAKSELLHILCRLVDETKGWMALVPGYREEDLQDAIQEAEKVIKRFRPIVLEEINEG